MTCPMPIPAYFPANLPPTALFSRMVSEYVCVSGRVCFARKTSNYFRMQISGFSADFLLFSFFVVMLPHGSRPTPHPGQRERETGWRKETETDSWSAPNLSQWYADKTNKYQRFFFIPFRLVLFFLLPAVPFLSPARFSGRLHFSREKEGRLSEKAEKLH